MKTRNRFVDRHVTFLFVLRQKMLSGDRHLYLGPFGFWGRKSVRAAVPIDALVENELLRNQVIATGFCVSPMLIVLFVLEVSGRKVLLI